MKDRLCYNKKTGQLAIQRHVGFKHKDWKSNYAMIPVDPVSFAESYQQEDWIHTGQDWKQLPCDDPRVQFVELFSIIDGADWYVNCTACEDNHIDEMVIENPHEVFKKIRKLFKNRR